MFHRMERPVWLTDWQLTVWQGTARDRELKLKLKLQLKLKIRLGLVWGVMWDLVWDFSRIEPSCLPRQQSCFCYKDKCLAIWQLKENKVWHLIATELPMKWSNWEGVLSEIFARLVFFIDLRSQVLWIVKCIVLEYYQAKNVIWLYLRLWLVHMSFLGLSQFNFRYEP